MVVGFRVASHSLYQRQTSQWAHGSGYVGAASPRSQDFSRRALTRRKEVAVGDSVSFFCEVDRGRHNVHEFGSVTLHGSE